MCPRKPVADANSAPQPAAFPPPQAFQASPPPSVPQFVAAAPPTQSQVPTGWTTGLCACFDDPSNCCITFFCPCVTFGQTAEVIDKGNTSCFRAETTCALLFNHFGLFCCYTCTYRTKLPGLYSLHGDQCGDFCTHCWCTCCALCQEYRELKNRGLDPSIGWAGNQQKMQQPIPVVLPPVVPMGMMRN
ncbi:protein PLANT CADMIUM RESISTANCE 7-like [Punica granatum]|uniref:Protein PLANT CADMIUM RESISTANCE 7-like n=1 Tax=Punica granatum TaxID=22663 RepID=A0A218Y0J1_PUNGR|nr:protein PLANT CADMIUM RESISTANCE 7-like [Punica granatum]OWM90311.1 hypothetical protein CDL15_Pgr014613 [Punica granatum]